MKTNLSARVLSWLLALCMLVGIAPAIPADSAQAAEEGVYVYSFIKLASINLLVDTCPDGVDSFDDTTEGQPWKFVNHTKTNFRNYSIGTAGLYVGSQGTATTNIVLKLPEAGYYDVTAEMLAQLRSAGTHFTFIACDENGNALEGATESAKYWVAGLGPAGTYPVSSVGKHYFDCEYVLVKYNVHRIDGTYYSTYLKNLTLTKLNLDIDVETPPAIALDDSAVIPVVASTVSAAGKSAVALTAVSASSDLVDIALVDGNVVATAKKLGTEAVPVTFTAAGASETVNVVFSVFDPLYNTDKTYTYNILKAGAPHSNMESGDINSYNMMTPGATGEINPQFESSPWKVLSASKYIGVVNTHYYGALTNKLPNTIKFKFLLPENGIYNYYGKHATHSAYSAKADVYLQKVGAAEGDEFYENTCIGTVNTTTTDTAWSWDKLPTDTNPDLALTAGEYILTWEVSDIKGSYFFFDGFEFVGQEGMNPEVEATATLSYPEVEIDGTAEPTLTVDTTATSYSIAYASDNEAVATVDPVTGVVTGVSAGTAKITVTISGNAVATAEYTVTVKEDEPEYETGDVNGDGNLNVRDIVALRRYIAGGYDVIVIEERTDINGDGNLNVRDVVALRKIIAG